jgi:hypothetical protein
MNTGAQFLEPLLDRSPSVFKHRSSTAWIQTGSVKSVSQGLCCFALIWSHKFAIVCRSFSHVVPISLDEASVRVALSRRIVQPPCDVSAGAFVLMRYLQ